MGFISVAAGDGLKELSWTWAAPMVSGGQTMNPSPRTCWRRCWPPPPRRYSSCPTTRTSSWPQEQTVPLATDREVIVIPTRTIPRAFPPCWPLTRTLTETNQEAMLEAAGNVDTGLVTFAARIPSTAGTPSATGHFGPEKRQAGIYREGPGQRLRCVARSFANKHPLSSH